MLAICSMCLARGHQINEVLSMRFLMARECFRFCELGADSEGDAKYGCRSPGVASRAAVRVERVSTAELHVVATRRRHQRDVTSDAGRR